LLTLTAVWLSFVNTYSCLAIICQHLQQSGYRLLTLTDVWLSFVNTYRCLAIIC